MGIHNLLSTLGYASKQLVSGMDIMTIKDLNTVGVSRMILIINDVIINDVIISGGS